jgi:hypothetical protein
MTRFLRVASSLAVIALTVAPAAAAPKLNGKEEARVARASPDDQDMVRECLLRQKKGKKTGTIAGAAGGAGTSIIAGGSVGVTALAAGAGALVGRAVGSGTSTNESCDDVLARN